MTADPSTAATGAAPAQRGRVRRSRGGPQPYDFRRPTKMSREHVRALQIVLETFARQWTTLLASSLRTVAQVGVVSIEQLTYDEYVASLENPTVMHLVSVEPLEGTGVLETSMAQAMVSVDHMLGGPGTGAQPERPLSDIEGALLRQLMGRVLGELRYAFEPIVRLEPALTAIEYNPQFAQAGSAADMVVVSSFEVKIGDVESIATLCLPFASLFPILEVALGHGVTTERERLARDAARRSVAEGLAGVPVDVAVRFRPVSLTPRLLLGLAVGDVLPLPHPLSAPLAVSAADVVFARAVAGAQGRRLACLVVDDTTPPGESPA